jgi:hypothetical protein
LERLLINQLPVLINHFDLNIVKNICNKYIQKQYKLIQFVTVVFISKISNNPCINRVINYDFFLIVMICPCCKNTIHDDARFCIFCGRPTKL